MKKLFSIILLILAINSSRDLSFRRVNQDVLRQLNVENTATNLESVNGFTAYDLMQAKLNSGRLFIRDKIIHQ